MSKEVLWIWTVETLTGLAFAVEDARREANARGHHPETVYVKHRIFAIEETLADGSKVMNLHIGEHERSAAN